MGYTYKIYDQENIHYITCTVHQLVDVFTRREYIDIFPEEMTMKDFFGTKATFIHPNPVGASIVEKEEEYVYSSCGDFYKGIAGIS